MNLSGNYGKKIIAISITFAVLVVLLLLAFFWLSRGYRMQKRMVGKWQQVTDRPGADIVRYHFKSDGSCAKFVFRPERDQDDVDDTVLIGYKIPGTYSVHFDMTLSLHLKENRQETAFLETRTGELVKGKGWAHVRGVVTPSYVVHSCWGGELVLRTPGAGRDDVFKQLSTVVE